jgi:hypothetical protein
MSLIGEEELITMKLSKDGKPVGSNRSSFIPEKGSKARFI